MTHTDPRMNNDRAAENHAAEPPAAGQAAADGSAFDDGHLFRDAAEALLSEQSTPQQIRAIEAGDSPAALWAQLQDAGFADALVPEACGGAGLSLAQVFEVWALCGRHALPVPLAETTMARALLASLPAADGLPADLLQAVAGQRLVLAEGSLVAAATSVAGAEPGDLRCGQVALGAVADAVLVQHDGGWQLLPVAAARAEPAGFCLDRVMTWPAAVVQSTPRLAIDLPAIDLPAPLTVRTLQATVVAAQLAGALGATFERTLQYANDRSQFGRPIGKFQAIQHQLAVMSEHVFAARMAAQLGCRSAGQHAWLPDPLRVAVAKARTSAAALAVAETAHSIHGAIGFTAEYDLQLHTRRLHAWRQTAGSERYWYAVAGGALIDGHAGLTLDLLRTTTDLPTAASA